jgi:hypothetical protein
MRTDARELIRSIASERCANIRSNHKALVQKRERRRRPWARRTIAAKCCVFRELRVATEAGFIEQVGSIDRERPSPILRWPEGKVGIEAVDRVQHATIVIGVEVSVPMVEPDGAGELRRRFEVELMRNRRSIGSGGGFSPKSAALTVPSLLRSNCSSLYSPRRYAP